MRMLRSKQQTSLRYQRDEVNRWYSSSETLDVAKAAQPENARGHHPNTGFYRCIMKRTFWSRIYATRAPSKMA